MAGGISSSSTLHESSPQPVQEGAKLDLSKLPPIFVSATHFETENLHALEEELTNSGAALTYDIHEARIVLSKATRKTRIEFDLRAKGLWTEELKQPRESLIDEDVYPPAKKAKVEDSKRPSTGGDQVITIEDSSTASEADDGDDATVMSKKSTRMTMRAKQLSMALTTNSRSPTTGSPEVHVIKVVRIDWFAASQKLGQILPLDQFLTYTGHRVEKPPSEAIRRMDITRPSNAIVTSTGTGQVPQKLTDPTESILERAREDVSRQTFHDDRFGQHKFAHTVSPSIGASWSVSHSKSQYTRLLHTTTSEYESGESSDLPEIPEWVLAGVKYACQRVSPRTNPNDSFIALLKKIKLARLLTNDEIGVRAYSTSIAAIAAYTYKISSPKEIMLLPGCDTKLANLFVEWANTGKIQVVEDIEADEGLKVLRLFYEIWGVGAATAREFYHDRGWKDLDDIVEHGWSTLSRVQQIGVKYYDEFLDPIPRAEVSEIGRIIHRHASNVRDKNIQSLIVGGYRRGKEACGDVDIIVSHPDEKQTLNLINHLVNSLEDEGWITHTLLLSLNNTSRNQQTLPFRAGGGGHGFDSLDKALVVWQDPSWPSKASDLAKDEKVKNPNIHRRVDIIIAPWRTVGCAIMGWSGGTTFQRDLRRYVKATRGWKFDSSGVRDRGNGEVIDIEGFYRYEGGIGEGRARGLEEAEKRVFEGMGLVYREPWERCTE